MTSFTNHERVAMQAGVLNIHGNITNYGVHHRESTRREAVVSNYNFGLRLSNAPQIDEDYFVGRDRELEQLRSWLTPRPSHQNVVALCGLGGMGKTQLSIHFARKFIDTYSSVFWLSGKDESTLKAGLAELAAQVVENRISPSVDDAQEGERMAQQARQWLSQPGNDKWLVVYDNYDDPRLPGMDNSTGYDIRHFFPHKAQGSILITTRSPRLTYAKQLRLNKLDNIDQSLSILATRSGREINGDSDATTLVKRLDGLPLALATAGAYLNQTADSFSDYLQLYNDSWNDLGQYSGGLLDYEDRTLYSTWNLSLQQVRSQDPEATELLRLMAYLDNQDVWYELFQAGLEGRGVWWSEVVKNKVRFNRAMSKLHDYSLVETSGGSYSLHTCVHDWSLGCLNRYLDDDTCQIAVCCVANSVKFETEEDFWVINRRLLQHVQRLKHNRVKESINWNNIDMGNLYRIGRLYNQLDMKAESEGMFMRALRGYEKAWGPEHTSTLDIVLCLGLAYADQGKMAEAEEMYVRALRGYEKAWGPEHTSTLDTVNNLGLLYTDQGKMAEAEEMHMRALRGYEKAWGPEHTSTLDTVNNLGLLYARQGKMAEAERMYMRALQGYEKAWGPEHTLTLNTVNNLGILYARQGKMAEAEEMYMRALRGKEKAWGPEHTSTLNTVGNLGLLYAKQGKMVEAERMYMRALRGYEKARGPEHTSTLDTVHNLGILYADQGKMAEAEEMFVWALRRYEKAWGPEHTSTLNAVGNLGLLYTDQGKMAEAEEMCIRALQGYEKAMGANHSKTRVIARNLNRLRAQGSATEL